MWFFLLYLYYQSNMIDLRILIIVTVTYIVCYGLWYLIFWFLTSQPNLFLWTWWVKLLYLLFASSYSVNFIDKVKENEE